MTTWLLVGALLAGAAGGAGEKVEADVILRGGTLHDGSGGKGVLGDLAIKGDRIVAVGTFTTSPSCSTYLMLCDSS